MAQKWIIGVIGAFAVLALAGVGFSAFTAQATVNGSAAAATVNLQIVGPDSTAISCLYLPTTPYPYAPAPGNVSLVTGEGFSSTATFSVSNLTPGVYCGAYVTLENTGSVPENVSVALSTQGANGICAVDQINCFDVATQSGIEASGLWSIIGSPTAPGPATVSNNFVTLGVGGTYSDFIVVLITTGSTSAPSHGTFTLTYTASAGI
ncbi:MAG TPA: hypothetical protein VMG36_04220 [Thermoplasmata archaeon]|nr:hypothetical protein [Thermoplasmata archaeon]